MGWKEWYVIGVSLATVALWCANTALQPYLGQMGITAIVPMVGFFGFGILNKARCPSLPCCCCCCSTSTSGAMRRIDRQTKPMSHNRRHLTFPGRSARHCVKL